MEIFLARQPIFNRNRSIFGYELLFRDGFSTTFPSIDGNTATSTLLSNSFLCMGIDQISGGKKSFINFTQDLILQKIPLLFPPNKIIVEILENVYPTDELILACQEMARAGYELALDDFIYDPSYEPLIALANIIKIDLRQTPIEEIPTLLGLLSKHRVKLLAEKVETYSEFEKCLEAGFDFYQGYFFSKPQVLKGRDILTARMTLLQIMAEISQNDIDISRLEKLIAHDVAISYKLLRYINSVFFHRGKEIASIRQAITRLGDDGIRRFIPIVLMARCSSDKPDELIRTSIIRARFCELIGQNITVDIPGSELFTLGLFSLIDAILDNSMDEIITDLPFSSGIRNALIRGTGKMMGVLNLIRAYEIGDWSGVSHIAADIHLSEEKIPILYWDAVSWADAISSC
ncbi:MAG: EAL and HDOD domain-containing protein [Desulfatirhabdiaceae bacterium]